MKQFKFLLATLALLCTSAAWAQTDVTDTYLTNADFSQSTPLTGHLRGYGKDMADGDVYGIQEVDGWSFEMLASVTDEKGFENSGLGGGVFAYGSTNQVKGNSKTAPTADPDGNAGNCLAFFAVWSNGGYYYQDVTFPAGEYTITIPVYNQSGTQSNTTYIGFIPNSGTAQTFATNPTVGEWTTCTKTFTLTAETAGKIALGYKSTGSGSGSNPMLFFDKVTILYKSTVIKDELDALLVSAKALNNDINNSSLGMAISEAQIVYENPSASQAEVNAQVTNLSNAIKTAQVEYVLEYHNATPLIYNWGFELSEAATTNWAAGGSANSADYADTGWRNVQSASWSSSAVVAYGGAGQVNGASAPTADNAGRSGNALGISIGWSGTVTYQSQSITLPAGAYTLTVNAYNNFTSTAFNSRNGFVPASGTAQLSNKASFPTGEWTTDVVKFTLNEITTGVIQIGGLANDAGSGSHAKVFFDNITLTWEDPLAASKQAYQEALSAAQKALDDNTDVVDPAREALEAEVAKTEPTTEDGYTAATDALQTKTAAFLAAAEAYNANKADLENEIAYAGSIGVATTDAETVLNAATSTGADFLAATEALKVLEYNTFAGEGTEYTVDVTTTYVDPSGWEGNIGTTSGQHWNGGSDSYMDKWNGSAAIFSNTQTVSLPAGDYVFMTPGRGVKGIPVTMTVGETTVSYPTKGDVGYGIDVDGKANFSPEGTYANNNQGRGWEWRYVPVTLTEAGDVTVTLTLDLKAGTWGSFTDLVILAKPSPALVLDELLAAIEEATAIREAQDFDAIVDKEPFQYSVDACNALTSARSAAVSVYNNASDKTMEDVEQATADLLDAIETFNNSELVAPETDHLYNLVLTDEGFSYAGNPITFKKGNANSGGYAIGYSDNPGSPYNQDILFEAAEGVNCYYMYIKDAANNIHYVGTGKNYNGDDYQLRMTDIKENALVLKAERKYNVLSFINTKTSSYVGSNGDAGFYTSDKNHKFEIRNFVPTEFTLKVADGKYGTVIFPSFPVSDLYSGLKFYTCEEVDGTELVLNEVKLEAVEIDKPYIIQNVGGVDKDITKNINGMAYSTEPTDLTFGLLTGLYSGGQAIPAGKYVLQTKDGVQSFRKVPEGGMTGTKFRAYLTYDGGGEINALGFQADETTAIHGIDALLNGEGAEAIYTADGARIAAPQKGLNIIKMSNGKTVKVLIK